MSKKLTSSCNDALQVNQNPLENIENLIFNIRGKQVMLDRDLARLYGVETRVLNQAVKRNIKRFPEDFMFRLTKNEVTNLKSQFV
ncbi:MAG: ORF6N domain-containing protein, partial [Paludibacteraceae bacterium]|nr:ORF6N domain-containing protein [Paludibacteraceae bacterium]MBR3871676.1 ORF6N domain-containing protein [Paludibacteraceae bacterium]